MGLRVLSLFDGISCGRIALERAEIDIDTYYASEVCDCSMDISKKNYSNIIQRNLWKVKVYSFFTHFPLRSIDFFPFSCTIL